MFSRRPNFDKRDLTMYFADNTISPSIKDNISYKSIWHYLFHLESIKGNVLLLGLFKIES